MVDSVNYPNKQTKYHVESIIYEYNIFSKEFVPLQTIQTDGYVMIPLFFSKPDVCIESSQFGSTTISPRERTHHFPARDYRPALAALSGPRYHNNNFV